MLPLTTAEASLRDWKYHSCSLGDKFEKLVSHGRKAAACLQLFSLCAGWTPRMGVVDPCNPVLSFHYLCLGQIWFLITNKP